jgi:hypothetical protein
MRDLAMLPHKKISVQCVMGVVSESDLEGIFRIAAPLGIRVTLLGYKRVGRGKNHLPYTYDWLPGLIRKAKRGGWLPWVSIDTVLADDMWDKLMELGVPRVTLDRKDGLFSMYIDAVEDRAGPASYLPTEPLGTFLEDDILGVFRRWQEMVGGIKGD